MLAAGTRLQNRYRILRTIGQGGMGAVYEAVDERLGNPVALKETLVHQEALRQAFEREARTLASLRHPALTVVIDHFVEGEGQYLVMQYIPGEDMAEMVARRPEPFPVAQVVRWADQLLAALEYLHGHAPPILHRDIKPGNLKLTPEGDLILLDFGLAKNELRDHSRVSTASIFGYTPNYAPLEQIQGEGTDPRSDLYAVGATLYHLLTGQKPPDALARANARLNEQPDPLRPANEVNPAVSPSVAAVVARALSLNAAQRPASAAALRQALREATGEATLAVTQTLPAAPPARAPRPAPRSTPAADAPRKRWPWLAGVLLLLLFLILGRNYLPDSPTAEGVNPPAPTASRAAQPTSTAGPTAAPFPTFLPVSIEGVANAPLDFEGPPPGEIVLGDVPFRLSERVFKSQAAPPPHDVAPVSAQLAVTVPRAIRLHLLLNSANGFAEFEGESIGRVQVECEGARVQVRSLRLGREVREWHEDANVVSTATSTREVWRGARLDFPTLTGHIDLLSIDLPAGCRDGTLTLVEILDTSVESVGSLDPALNLVGLTIEQQP